MKFRSPIVDFTSFARGDPAARQECANKILEAFPTVGFVYLSNAVALETIDKALSLSKQFFAKPVEEKVEVEWESFVGKRGFVMKGRHLNTLAFQVRSLMISIGREQIFNLDDMLVLRHNGKFNKSPSMKLHSDFIYCRTSSMFLPPLREGGACIPPKPLVLAPLSLLLLDSPYRGSLGSGLLLLGVSSLFPYLGRLGGGCVSCPST